jgi:hypothetical protein
MSLLDPRNGSTASVLWSKTYSWDHPEHWQTVEVASSSRGIEARAGGVEGRTNDDSGFSLDRRDGHASHVHGPTTLTNFLSKCRDWKNSTSPTTEERIYPYSPNAHNSDFRALAGGYQRKEEILDLGKK